MKSIDELPNAGVEASVKIDPAPLHHRGELINAKDGDGQFAA